ncbi:rRNA maturation RNase YbeY [Salipiger sp. P9]|uniref:rRNA maturation RNase YbeY n=1 Tax=Salipiger pentaromativorans TaxID=2943193 RepID=UPI00215829C5|nr:rRNA maturation RNase YbeY [Salipiger pentaromativorans]MCR8546645.1 rRNA maturation RNase YbeY [Salipiger pentaromativorans]
MLTDTIIEDDRWDEAGLESLAETAACAALTHLALDPERFEIAILACDDARIAGLNAEFREKPTPTNVLSWPSEERSPEEPPQGGEEGLPEELGDIAIAYETCIREAEEQGKPLADHLTHLIVHATLHLLGYDHIRDADATLMETLEVEILGKLGVANPYSQG